jgi:hypothetical protein
MRWAYCALLAARDGAALHPGYETSRSRQNILWNLKIPIDGSPNSVYIFHILCNEGRFMRRSEAAQRESWPEGQPEG